MILTLVIYKTEQIEVFFFFVGHSFCEHTFNVCVLAAKKQTQSNFLAPMRIGNVTLNPQCHTIKMRWNLAMYTHHSLAQHETFF